MWGGFLQALSTGIRIEQVLVFNIIISQRVLKPYLER